LDIYAYERKRMISEECMRWKLQEREIGDAESIDGMIIPEKISNSVPSTKNTLRTALGGEV